MLGLGLGISLSSAGVRAPWSPELLFASGEIGWVEPMIPGVTLYQDAAGTIPVTAAGQPVGLSKFTAGGQLGFVQATALNRPIYQLDAQGRGYLAHNGNNQWMVCAAFAWGSDKATICAGVRKLSDAAIGVFTEFSAAITGNIGSFGIFAPAATSGADAQRITFASRGSTGGIFARPVDPIAAPVTAVVSALGDISGDLATLRVNGTQVAQSTNDQGTGNFGTYPLYAGARAGSSLFFSGGRYPSVGINRLLTEAELVQLEAWVNVRTGAY